MSQGGFKEANMASTLQILPSTALRRIHQIQGITIAWMSVEVVVGMWAALRAHSPAILAFAGDSTIELLSAGVVLWRFRTGAAHERDERRAARVAGGLLLALAVYVAVAAAVTLLGYNEARPTYVGIVLLAAAALVMPWLAREKRQLSMVTGSAALRADAAESALCAYLSLIALAGLATHAIWHVAWADPVAALVITPLIVWEARQALRGKACGCC
jgi:divalent metal cation (Fe/Co/Zn/Cd) transporter